ncbi:EscU/YscU/HrcU family type III secretion system export apparatus switch protein [Chitinibacter fontanus]|uniref:EscU/YscU/HrcU family type III secretion system export apparatus switch protein n=2 Tax=Chitinibacter fontanus TaxID=1737446 RepID=A0A7D5ZJ12_9NEIS|nr:EscU/YscU/HrcU family type III secretion system export apparatus switch protein [Chitinibacter fontanus]QLI83128.1 EscU/YscU/HrcU family type III secretion system export apparatus switch protein [Chitinibacter fontanus]
MSDKTAKRSQAIALAYREGSAAPRVVAKGKGMLAEKIIEKAREAGIFVHDSPEMVALLMQVDLDSQIPPQLYRAVAELLAFIYMLERGEDIAAPDFSYLSETTQENSVVSDTHHSDLL